MPGLREAAYYSRLRDIKLKNLFMKKGREGGVSNISSLDILNTEVNNELKRQNECSI
jgi:hypothetical protein